MNLRPLLIVIVATVGATIALAVVGWVQLPPDAQVPIHWGVDGQVNGTAPKIVSVAACVASSRPTACRTSTRSCPAHMSSRSSSGCPACR